MPWGGVKRILIFVLYAYWYRKLSAFSIKTGFQVGLHTCDWGLKFQHIGPIIINKQAKIGKNFRVYPQTLIGMAGVGNIPQIGDNVHLCSGSRVIGKVKIGNNVVIAPNSLIIKDVPDNAVMVSTPASILKYRTEV